MTQLRLTFRLQRDHAVAVIPPELPISRQTALVLSHYCVPTLPGQPQGLLLCGEEKYRVWIREWSVSWPARLAGFPFCCTPGSRFARISVCACPFPCWPTPVSGGRPC